MAANQEFPKRFYTTISVVISNRTSQMCFWTLRLDAVIIVFSTTSSGIQTVLLFVANEDFSSSRNSLKNYSSNLSFQFAHFCFK